MAKIKILLFFLTKVRMTSKLQQNDNAVIFVGKITPIQLFQQQKNANKKKCCVFKCTENILV